MPPPNVRQQNIKRLASRVMHAEALAIATRYLVENHSFSEVHAEDQARATLTDPSHPPVVVRVSEGEQRFWGEPERRIQFRYRRVVHVDSA